jgi:hypothetical protein
MTACTAAGGQNVFAESNQKTILTDTHIILGYSFPITFITNYGDITDRLGQDMIKFTVTTGTST